MTVDSTSLQANPQRVVILGGGAAGVAAAYWLSIPEQEQRYDVTLYTQGWRLGGKCASGRDAEKFDSIEEHGLHLLMGCYQNGFATMRRCYQDWRKLKQDPSNMLQTWTDAFLPQRQVSMMAQDGPGTPASWSPWNFPFPKLLGDPGDGPLVPGSTNDPLPPDEIFLLRMANWLRKYIPTSTPYYNAMAVALTALEGLFYSTGTPPADVQQKLKYAAQAIRANMPGISSWINVEADFYASQLLHRLAILADLGIAMALGFLMDLYGRGGDGFDNLDRVDLRAWLKTHGASQTAVDSAPINAFYDLTFAATNGNQNSVASIAAGVSFRTLLEMAFGYRGAPLWKMAAGMGDIVFTPLYEVLVARGVKVKFFSRVNELRPSGDGSLGEIEIITQATTIGQVLYKPLQRIKCTNGKELDVWFNQPDWDQLTNGAKLKAEKVDFEYSGCTISVGQPKILKAGTDFDLAISAIPPEALKPLTEQLTTASTDWRNALQQSVSVATQSLQLWMKSDLCSLGWPYGTTVLTAFAKPYDSWGDMSQVIAAESWPEADGPQSIGYFCGCMEYAGEPTTLGEMAAKATAAASDWMNSDITTLWPKIGANPVSSENILNRYGQANFDLSDLYVQTPAGRNVSSRFDPRSTAGFSNFYAIGDWTKTRFSGGCFESAIESAMLAVRAISGIPKEIKTANS